MDVFDLVAKWHDGPLLAGLLTDPSLVGCGSINRPQYGQIGGTPAWPDWLAGCPINISEIAMFFKTARVNLGEDSKEPGPGLHRTLVAG